MAQHALRRRYGHAEASSDLGTIYDQCVAAGCEIDSHESDLYVKATPEARAITAKAPNRSFFHSQRDGQTWIEIPFGYKPFWDRKARR